MQESFWEHNPSKKEIEKLFGKLKKEEIEKRLGPPPHYAHIVDLYYLRGQDEKAKEYLKKMGLTWDRYIANAHFDVFLEEN
ncbi:MAG: hypothetical protein DRP61_06065 [Candidatus Omnitrophota bacterium]|nr:MAG: hypothetical protein DRP61_06065 [Candidatus Omnitrophota bacterium]